MLEGVLDQVVRVIGRAFFGWPASTGRMVVLAHTARYAEQLARRFFILAREAGRNPVERRDEVQIENVVVQFRAVKSSARSVGGRYSGLFIDHFVYSSRDKDLWKHIDRWEWAVDVKTARKNLSEGV